MKLSDDRASFVRTGRRGLLIREGQPRYILPARVAAHGYAITALSMLVKTFSFRCSLSIAVTTVLLRTLTMNAMSRSSTSESFAPFSSARFTAFCRFARSVIVQLDLAGLEPLLGMTGECQAAEFLLEDGLECGLLGLTDRLSDP